MKGTTTAGLHGTRGTWQCTPLSTATPGVNEPGTIGITSLSLCSAEMYTDITGQGIVEIPISDVHCNFETNTRHGGHGRNGMCVMGIIPKVDV